MPTTYGGTSIVSIRVDLFNDILRFDYALQFFFFLNKDKILYALIAICSSFLAGCNLLN